MTERPLSKLQERCLVSMISLEIVHGDDAIFGRHAFSPNEIGELLRLAPVHQHKWRPGTKGAAQRIIQPLTGLRQRGLIHQTSRDDGWSGTAYRLTDEGRALARDLRRKKTVSR